MKRCLLIVSILALGILCLATTYAQSVDQKLSPRDLAIQQAKAASQPRIVDPQLSTRPSPGYQPQNSFLTIRLTQDFTDVTFPPSGWTSEYTGTLYWTRNAASGYLTGVGSAKFDFWSATTGITQSLVTSTFTPTVAGDSLKFDYAHAFYSGSIDSLYVETSTDGGTTYSILVGLYGSTTPYLSLSTVSSTSLFTPSVLSDWGTKKYAVPVGTNKIRFRARSDFGNNLYLDNIIVGTPPPPPTVYTINNTLPTGGTNYNNFTDAINAINLSGVGPGGVTFNVSAGQTFTELPPPLKATGTVDNPIVFQKSGSGANPKVLGTNGVGTLDACFTIVGGDYITMDGIDVQDNPANTTTTTQMEYGYFLVKLSATDGAQNVTIKNCAITLTKANTATRGIYQSNVDTLGTTVTVTAASGASSFNKYFNLTIANTYIGIYLNGYAAATPYDLYDQSNEVGVGGANSITNYGGGAVVAYGSYAIYQNNLKLANNTVTSGPGTTTTLYGLYQSTGGSVDIYDNTVTLTGGGTTSTIGAIYNAMGSSGTTNTVNIYNNTVTGCTYPTGTTAAMYLLYNGSSPLNCNMYGNTVTGNQSPTTSTMYCIYQGGSPSGTLNMYNNTVTNNIKDSTGVMYCLYGFPTSTTVTTIHDNSIHGNRAIGGTLYGLMTSSSATSSVYKNSIYDQTCLRAAGVAWGIYVSSGTTVYVYNNFVSDIKTPEATGLLASAGIYVSSPTTCGVYYNSIFLNASSSAGTTFGNAGIYTSTTPTVELRDNIVVNKSTPGATGGLVAAYRRSSTTLTTYASTSNTNCFFAGTPSATRVIFYDGTNFDSTLAAYKGRVSPVDAGSISEDAPFINSTVPPYNLHISATTPTQIESGGTTVTTPIAITTDYDGDSRNATTPDIGADEFAGIGQDFTPPAVTYTPLKNTALFTQRTLTTTITDPSGLPTSGIGLPRIYWRINSASYTIATGTYVSGNTYTFPLGAGVVLNDTVSYFIVAQDNVATPNVGATPSGGAGGFTANPPAASIPPTTPSRYFIIPPPLAAGDYTIGLTGFDRLTGKNLTAQTFTRRVMREVPVGPPIDHKATKGQEYTSLITPFQNTEMREVEETYSVLMDNNHPYEGVTRVDLTDAQRAELGLSDRVLATYATITAALADLNLRGVSGAIRFLLDDTTYATETYPLTINIGADSVPSASKPFTIKPNTGRTTTIAGALASGPIFKILNSYVTIDGSNAVGGATRNLTVQNTSTTTPQVILFGSLGTTPITNGTLKNTIVINGIKTSSAVIISDGVAAGTQGYFDNMTVQNNDIRNAYISVYATGGTVPQRGTNVFYLQNAVNDTSNAYVGLYMQGVNGATIRQNDIGNFNTVTSQDDKGMWLATGTINAVVERNKIHDLGYTGTGGYGAHGVYVSSGQTAANITVRNNMISHLYGDGYSYTSIMTDNPIGIVFTGTQTGCSAYYNSINLYGSTLNQTSALSMGIGIGVGSVADLRDNLIVNNLGLLLATGYGATAVYASTANTQFTAINYNDYYVNAASPTLNIIGKIAATDYTTLSAWAAASGGDLNSISANVNYVAPTDLHIVSSAASPVDSAATPITSVTDDYDGNLRNATRPDIGADEFNVVVVPPPVVSLVARSTRVPVAGDTLVVTCTITDTLGIATASILYASDGVAQTPVTMTRTSGTPQLGTYRGVLPGSANVNGKRIEYRILGLSTSGLSTTTTVTANNSYFAGLSPLSLTGVKAVSGTGQLLYANYYARVSGTINGPNFQTVNLGYNFQDAVGGIDLFKSGTVTPVLALGDSVIVLGKLAQFRGLTEITPDTVTVDIQIVATGRPVVPLDITVPAFYANPELYESRVLRMTSLRRRDVTPPWPPLGTSANIVMYQGVVTDTIIMRIDSDTEIDGSPEPTYPITVTGVITQFTSTSAIYNDGYQTQPRYLTDFSTAGLHDIGIFSYGAGASLDGPSGNNLSKELAAEQLKKATVTSQDEASEGDQAVTASVTIEPVLEPRSTDLQGDAPVNFRALVRNYGTYAETTYQVGWTIDGTPQTPTNQPRILQVGATDTVTLTWANPTAGAHVTRAFTILASDANRSNDTSAPYNFNVSPEGIVFQEGFNGTIPPYPTGWHVKNRDLGGTSTYFQGNPTVFTAYEGASYIGANYQAANGTYIDEWLVTPNTGGLLGNPNAVIDSLIFWQRSPSNQSPYYADSIQIRVSTTDTAVASFTTVLDYFRVDTIGWRRKAYALPTAANRYIAFRYLHYNGGSGAYSNYIGLDAVQISRTFVPTPGWSLQTSGITNQFYSVKAVNATTAWAAALGGRVLRTVDGGNTWTSVGGGRIGTADIYNITAVDANIALVTTTPSTTTYIFRTTSGGAVWDTVYQLAGGFIDAMHMYNATNGIAMGDPTGGPYVILKTSNGGATWARIATQPTPGAGEASSQNDLCVFGLNNIWFGASANGKIYRSTDAGATWASSTIPGAVAASNVIAVWFNSAQYGIASSVNGSTYTAYRSTDGGVTWTAVTVGTAGYNIAVGGSGNDDFWMARGTDVFRSTNRGATWASSYTGTGTFYDVDFYTSGSSTYGWGVKDNGNIVAAFFTITGVKEDIAEIPQSFNLMQNYPNPFNPTTTLRYGLPKEARVNLSIYNVLGQRIATLKDEVQNVGYYDVVWNGRNDFGSQIASGVYFYRIEAKPVDGGDAFTSIKKMLMLK